MQYELGMVLSGGGARGLAHVGVLKALSEEGIEPEILAATSAGAIVASLYASGYSADEMLEFFVQRNPFRISKLALAKPGIFDTDKVVADFLDYLPDNSFEALGKKILLTATDLVEGQPKIFSSGPLIPAILASASTPMVFAPTADRRPLVLRRRDHQQLPGGAPGRELRHHPGGLRHPFTTHSRARPEDLAYGLSARVRDRNVQPLENQVSPLRSAHLSIRS